jgi:hypothetical protein
MNKFEYTEKDLALNLNELAHEVLRELYLAAKKVSIYSRSHPLAHKAIARPFLQMEKVFHFKRYFNLHISSGFLYALNIRAKQSIFTEQIMDYMQILDLNSILFDYKMTIDELAVFLERFVKRLPTADFSNLMAVYLEKNKIDSIIVNSELGSHLFERGRNFRGDLIGDFSVRNIVDQIIGDDLEKLVDFLTETDISAADYVGRFNNDYHRELVAYLIPEKISSIEPETIIDLLATKIPSLSECADVQDHASEANIKRLRDLIASLDYHIRREDILGKISEMMSQRGIPKEIYSAVLPQTSTIRVESSEKIDRFLTTTFAPDSPDYYPDDFKGLFGRLLRTGQSGKAKSVINILLNYLAGDPPEMRERALILLRLGLSTYNGTNDRFLIEHIAAKVGEYLTEDKETFEFSDLLWEVIKINMAEKDYERLSGICDLLAKKRIRCQEVWAYESVAVKKTIEELNRREIIDQLVSDLVNGPNTFFPQLKNILITIGSEEAAQTLAHFISHESRQVRQQVLKVLSDMGKSSLNICAEVMQDSANFDRLEGKRELPDEKWYVVRNSIFVIGALRDPEGCRSLRLRIGDQDTRVRRAIIEALEKIAGDEAADLLLILADDADREIREAAIITISLVGTRDNVRELIELAHKHPSESKPIVIAMGKLGGNEAKEFLSRLLADHHFQSQFTSGRSSRDELKLATIKALGRIGDDVSIEKIKEFKNSLSKTQKMLLGGLKLDKAAEDILNRHND